MPTSARSFGQVAPYYDDLMKQVPYRMWGGYYLLLLANQDIHPHKILDICCGTGTMCELLTDEGFEMEGLDLSEGMVAEARRKAKKKHLNIRYEVADAANFDMGTTYDAAFSFFDSLNNIVDPDRLQSAFRTAARHVVPGGSFIFDLNTAYAFEQSLFDQENMRANAKLRYKWTGDWDPSSRIITVDMRFWYQDQSFREIHVQRAYGESEVREMLLNAGFGEIQVFNSYTLNPPRPKSDRLHFAARRL